MSIVTLLSKLGRRHVIIRLAKILLLATAAYGAVGFGLVPFVVRRVASSQLSERLGRTVQIDRLRMNPFALSVTIEGFRVLEADGQSTFVGWKQLYVNAELSSAFRLAPVLRQIRLEGLRLSVARLTSTPGAYADLGAYNFSDLLSRVTTADGSALPEAPPHEADAVTPKSDSEPTARFSFNNIELVDAALTFEDRPTGKRHGLTELNLAIPFISNLPVHVENLVQPGLRVRVDGAPFAIKGQTKPFKETQESTLDLRIDDLDLTKYLAYVPLPLPAVVASAFLDLDLHAAFARTKTPTFVVKGRVALERIAVRDERGGPLLDLSQLEVVVGKADVGALDVVVDQINITGLGLEVERGVDGRLNLETLKPPSAPPQAPSRTPKPALPRITVARVALADAKIHFRDRTVTPAFEVDLAPTLTARNLSTIPGQRGRFDAQLASNVGVSLANSTSIQLEPLALEGRITLEALRLPAFAPYVTPFAALTVRSGAVRAGATYQLVNQDGAPALGLEGAFFTLSDLALQADGAKANFCELETLTLEQVKLHPKARSLSVGKLASKSLRLDAERAADGTSSLLALIKTPPQAAGSTAGAGPPAPATQPAPPAEPAWALALGEAVVSDWNVRLVDKSTRPAARLVLDLREVSARGFSTEANRKGRFEVQVALNKRGRLQMSGDAAIQPLALDARLTLSDLALVPFFPYAAQAVNLKLTEGALGVKGRVQLQMPETGPKLRFTGDVNLAEVATVDPSGTRELLSFFGLDLRRIDASFDESAQPPLRLTMAEGVLSGLSANVELSPEGTLNVTALTPAEAKPDAPTTPAPAAPTKPSPEASAAPMPLSVARFDLTNAKIRYTDSSVRPAYATELTNLNATLENLSTSPEARTRLALSGVIDKSGTLEVRGVATPLAKAPSLDLHVEVKEVELPPASPFSGKYVGYTIAKGKLGLKLAYTLANKQLEAQNNLIVDQLSFGEKVESPDATNLPVRFAVALLKDRHGVIDLSVPISGSLDDPNFKIGAAIFKVLGNLIVKAAVSPFSLIASAFEGDDESSFVVFDPGSEVLAAKAKNKLSVLAKALQDRPGVSLELEGHADATKDRSALRQRLVELKLKQAKFEDLEKQGEAPKTADEVVLAGPERMELVRRVYVKEPFAKPKTFWGGVKEAPVDVMEKAIADHVRIDDAELERLATRRALAVKQTMTKQAPELAPRLFLVSPRLNPENRKLSHAAEFKFKRD